jgi:hypothetical protein
MNFPMLLFEIDSGVGAHRYSEDMASFCWTLSLPTYRRRSWRQSSDGTAGES